MRHPTIEETREFVRKIHEGQVDKAGEPYFGHLERVARYLCTTFLLATEADHHAAYLHDAVEDGCTTPCILESRGYSDEVIAIVELLTKEKDESYGEFIYRIATSGNKGAIRVKIADNMDNSNAERLRALSSPKRAELETKYKAARLILDAVLGDR